VRYDITLDPDRRRWHLAASWTLDHAPVPSVEQAVAGGVVAVDLNTDHLACWSIISASPTPERPAARRSAAAGAASGCAASSPASPPEGSATG
jgi:hypothetical protein